jgi:inner membrane protein
MMSRAGLNRVSPHATWLLLLSANAPDIDVCSALGGAVTYLHYHRNLTHALIFWPALALLCVVAVRLITRRPMAWGPAYLVALAGVGSHLLLDLTNVYGIRLFSPFSGRWFRLDITNVIDIWIWAALILAVLAPALSKLVQGEMGGAPHGPAGRASAICALSFMLLYDGGRYLLHERAVDTLASRIYNGAPPLRVAAGPAPVRLLRWRGIVETAATFHLYELDLAAEFDPGRGREFFKAEPSAAIAAATRTEPFQEFLRFSQYPLWQASASGEAENATTVEAIDLRFGDPSDPAFAAWALVDSRLQVLRAQFGFGPPRPR